MNIGAHFDRKIYLGYPKFFIALILGKLIRLICLPKAIEILILNL